MLVPMLDLTIERAAESGARDVVIGMAHRGRLNVLARHGRAAVRDASSRNSRAAATWRRAATPEGAPAT